MNDEPYNAAERSHVKAAAKASRFADKARFEVIRGIMDTTSGRAWMLGLLERCHVFASSFSTDGLSMAFREGERNIGLGLLADVMQSSPDNFTLMMREQDERNTGRNASRSPSPEPVGDNDDSAVKELIE